LKEGKSLIEAEKVLTDYLLDFNYLEKAEEKTIKHIKICSSILSPGLIEKIINWRYGWPEWHLFELYG